MAYKPLHNFENLRDIELKQLFWLIEEKRRSMEGGLSTGESSTTEEGSLSRL